jgi:hypothetical protein
LIHSAPIRRHPQFNEQFDPQEPLANDRYRALETRSLELLVHLQRME